MLKQIYHAHKKVMHMNNKHFLFLYTYFISVIVSKIHIWRHYHDSPTTLNELNNHDTIQCCRGIEASH